MREVVENGSPGYGNLNFRAYAFFVFIMTLAVVLLGTNQVSAAQAVQEITPYEENNPSLVYTGSWDHPWDDKASGSYCQRSYTKDAKMSFSFYGTGIKWYAPVNTNNGIAEVWIDGKVEVSSLDLYSSQYASQRLVYAKNHLDEGNHSFEIVVTGNKNASSSNSYVLIDYLQVIDSTDSDPPASPEAPTIQPADSSVSLFWKANTDVDFEGYNIYRSNSDVTGFQKINTWLYTGGNSYSDSGLTDGTTYYYRITAVDNKGNESNPSTAVSALPALYTGDYEESAGIAYAGTWENRNDGGSSGSYYKRSKTANDTIDIYFYGTSVKWTGYKNNSSGMAKVTIDGGTEEPVDLYIDSGTVYKQTIYEKTGLTDGLHHMSVKVLGTRSAGNDNWVNLDTLVVGGTVTAASKIEEDNIAIEYTGRWNTYTDSSYRQGVCYSTTLNGPTASYTFYGTGIEWLSSTNPDRGIARVTLDSEPYALIDLYNPSFIAQQIVYKRYNLPLGKHTIKIETTGTKSATSSNYHVPIDGFNVVDAVNAAPAIPEGLTATAGNGKIDLNWTTSGADAVAYRIYRTRSAIDDGIINLKPVRGTTYTDDNLIPGVAYSYKVTAVGALGVESELSEVATATPTSAGTGISVPSGVTALAPNTPTTPRYEEEQTGIVYSSGWDRAWDGSCSGSYYRRTNTEGATATINFSGTGVKWIAPRFTYGSTAEVWLDGRLDTIVSLYNGSNEYQKTVYEKTQLADGYHKLEIKCVGWNYIMIDSISVMGSADTTPPDAVTGVTLDINNTKLVVNWTSSTDTELDGYKVYRSTSPNSGFKAVGSTAMQMVRGATQYTDTGLVNGTTYYYIVTALDQNGNESVPSDVSNGVPAIPAALAGVHQENDEGMIYTGSGWSRRNDGSASGSYYEDTYTAGDEVSLTFYGTGAKLYSIGTSNSGNAQIFIDDDPEGTTVDLYRESTQYNIMAWQNDSPLALGVHKIRIRNTGTKNDSASNTRLIVDYLEITTSTDVTPPEMPSNLTAMRDGTSGSAYLQWTWGSDTDLFGYNIYRSLNGQDGSFTKINPDPVKFASMYIDSGAPATAFYKVAAVDTSGNVSDMSVAAALSDASASYITVEENNPLIKYTGVWNRSSDGGASGSYLMNSSDNNVTITYSFYGTGIDWLAATTSSSRTVMVKLDGGQPVRVDLYSSNTKYQVPVFRARNIPLGMHTIEISDSTRNSTSSNNYIYSDAFRLTGAETAPPSAPTDAKAEALVNKVKISWTNSSEPDVVGYNIYYRYGVFESQKVNLAGPVQSGFWHTGLNLNTMYYYTVKAVDSLGNESGASAEVSAQTADSLIKAVLEPSYNTAQGATITFDASNSYTADPPMTYEWDLDNDGVYDDATGVTATYTFASTGTFTIGLKVKDTMDRIDTTTATVTVKEPDVTPPLLITSEPANGTASVPLNAVVKFTFDEKIQKGSAFGNITMKDAANTPVAIAATIADKVLTITPAAAFVDNNSYSVYLPVHAIEDMAGNETSQDLSLSFGTPDTIQPAVSGTTVANVPGSGLSKAVNIAFSESIIEDGDYLGITVKDAYDRNISYTAAIAANVLTITTAATLENDTAYKVTLPANAVMDKSSNHFTGGYQYSFTTEAATHQIDQPYGYWKFDNTSLDDYGSGGHNGTIHGNPQVTTGVKDSAYSFDGTDDYAELGSWFNFEKFSISMWVNASDSQNTNYTDILDDYHNEWENWVIQNNKGASITQYGFRDANADIAPNTWKHVVWVKDAENSKIYIDGVLAYNAPSTAINYPGNQNLFIANWARSMGRNWKGSMDELRIYTYTLTQSEVSSLYFDSRPDSKPPVITSVSPVNAATIGGTGTEKLTVSFTEDGPIGNTSAKAEFSSDGTTWNLIGAGVGPTDSGNGTFSYSFNWNKEALTNGSYQVRFTVTDKLGNNAEQVVTYQVDRTAPAAVNDLDAAYNAGGVVVSWSTAVEADVTAYKVYRAPETGTDFTEIGTVNGRSTTTYKDTAVTLGNTYRYKVAAVDKFGQVGDQAGPVTVQLVEDSTKPTVLGIEPVNNSAIGAVTSITVHAQDDYKLKSVKLQYSTDGSTWNDVGTVDTTANATFTLNAPVTEGNISVRAIAIDAAGNESDGTPVRNYTIDTTGPAQVTGVGLIPSTSSIMVKWDDVEGTAYFKVEKKDSEDGTYQSIGTVSDKLYLNAAGLAPNKKYWFRVTAYDALNNMGTPSEEVSGTTSVDSAPPSITSISPAPGTYGKSIALSATVTDNVGVAKVTLQYSTDSGSTWQDMYTGSPSGTPATTTVSYTWNVSALAEGLVYVRAIAEDTSGNASNGASHVEYMIDHSGPAAPTGVTAATTSSKVTVTWTKNSDGDLHFYNIYRSNTDADSGYSLLKDSLSSLGYIDSGVEQGVTYYYKVTAVDSAGNEGEASVPVSAILKPDETAPVVVSFSPLSGSTLNKQSSINVLVTDDYKLKKVYMEYRAAGNDALPWNLLDTFDNLTSAESIYSFAVSKGTFGDGEYSFRVIAEDQYSHISQPLLAGYNINTMPPQAPTLSATPAGWKVNLSWTSNEEGDLSGYYIYRSTTHGGPYTKVTQAPKGYNSCVDDGNDHQGLSPAFTYYYVIDALDIYGNTSRSAEISVQPLADDPYAPIANAGDDKIAVAGLETGFDGTGSRDNDAISSYEWDFGDGSAKAYGAQPSHRYDAVGEYTVSLVVTDRSGNTASDTLPVSVLEAQKVGTLAVTVIDEATGNTIPYASVAIQYPDSEPQNFKANGSGIATTPAKPGDFKVYAYATGYMPAAADATVELNKTKQITISLKKGELVVGDLTVHRMTIDEIENAGIDTSAPENQWVYKFEVHLAFNEKPITTPPIISNGTGHIFNPQPIVITLPPTPGGEGGSTAPATVIAYPTVIPHPDHPEIRPTVAYMVIPGEARWLKEFFEVGLSLENMAEPEFIIADSSATLQLPDNGGLVLAPTKDPQSLRVDLGSIAGGQSRQVKWILRGDKKGYYDLKADFEGNLLPFNDRVLREFVTSPENQIHVWGDDAIKMHVDAQGEADQGYPYHVRFGIENIADVPVYNATIQLKDDTKQNYIYAPNQELEKSLRELPAGQTVWYDYWLIPSITGILNLSPDKTYVLKTGVNEVQIATEITSHDVPENYPPNTPVLHQVNNPDGTVTLTWDTVAGAKGYKIYKVKSDLTMSMDPPELVYTALATETSHEITDASGPNDYIITTLLAGETELSPDVERLKHAMTGLSWTVKAGAPVITIDPMEVYLNESSDLMITVNKEGLPVQQGTIDVGSYLSGQVLDDNGQIRVNFTPTALGDVLVSAYDKDHNFLVAKKIKVIERIQSSSISPAVAVFDKRATLQDDITVNLTLNGNTFESIKNGPYVLVEDTDYTKSGNTVILKKSYLAALDVGDISLDFHFSAGEDAPLKVTVIDSTGTDATLNTLSASFDKKIDLQNNITVTATLNGNTLNSIINTTSGGNTHLEAGTDYTISGLNGNVYTIKKEYLAAQPVGQTTLTFDFSAGADPSVDISITDSTPVAAKYTLTVNNGTGSGTYDAGSTVTVTATVPAGKTFSRWKDEAGTTLSTSETYSFTINRNMTITAELSQVPVAAPTVTLDNKVLYDTKDPTYAIMRILGTFKTPSGNALVDQGFISLKNPDADPGTSLTLETSGIAKLSALNATNAAGQVYRAIKTTYGNTFYVRGYLIYKDSAGNPQTIYSDSVVKAVAQRQVVIKYTLTVNNGTGSGTYDAGAAVRVTATVPVGKIFNRWKDEAGNTLSNSETYTLIINRNMTITAELSQAPVATPTVTLDNNVLYDTRDPVYVIMRILGTFKTPTGNTLIDQGFISLKNPAVDPGTSLTLETSGIMKLSALNATNGAGQAYRAIKTTYGNTFYVRGYLIYQDSAGNTQTIYSDNVVKAIKQTNLKTQAITLTGKDKLKKKGGIS